MVRSVGRRLTTLMSSFSLFSLIAAGATLLLILERLYRAPHVLVKPSFLVVVFLNLTSQWASALLADALALILPRPWEYFAVVQLFPALLLLVSLRFHDCEAREVYRRIRAFSLAAPVPAWWAAIRLLSAAAGLILLWYLREVPFTETGLYAMFFDPMRANLAREESMKLLQSGSLKYAYAVFSTTISPVLAVLLALSAFNAFALRERCRGIAFGFGVLLVVLAVSIYGARAPSAMILLTVTYAFLMRFYASNPFKWLPVLPLAFIVPTVFSTLRDFGELSWEGLSIHFANVVDRAFGRGIQDGVAHFLYVQKHGFFGIKGMGNLALLVGESSIDTFNVVGKEFLFTGIDSVSANTTFVIAYYGCLGMPSFLICAACLLLLDRVTVFCRSIRVEFLIPCVAGYQLAASNLVGTMFTTIFITYGFALIPLLCFLMNGLVSEPRAFLFGGAPQRVTEG